MLSIIIAILIANTITVIASVIFMTALYGLRLKDLKIIAKILHEQGDTLRELYDD